MLYRPFYQMAAKEMGIVTEIPTSILVCICKFNNYSRFIAIKLQGKAITSQNFQAFRSDPGCAIVPMNILRAMLYNLALEVLRNVAQVFCYMSGFVHKFSNFNFLATLVQ